MAKVYSDPERKELDMVFQFELMGIDGVRSGNWDPKSYTLHDLKKLMEKWQVGLEQKDGTVCFWATMIIRGRFPFWK